MYSDTHNNPDYFSYRTPENTPINILSMIFIEVNICCYYPTFVYQSVSSSDNDTIYCHALCGNKGYVTSDNQLLRCILSNIYYRICNWINPLFFRMDSFLESQFQVKHLVQLTSIHACVCVCVCICACVFRNKHVTEKDS